MIAPNKFYECLQNEGIEFIAGVPDSLLNDFCNYIQDNIPKEKHIITANEGNAIALAAGYNLATGSIPLVYMQNSGIGNSVNPLLSLTHQSVFSIPLLLLIGWRGDPAVTDHVQHQKQGELTPVLLDDLDIPYRILEADMEKTFNFVKWAVKTAKQRSGPTALIVKKGVLSKREKIENEERNSKYVLYREDAIATVLTLLPENTIYVATTGRATRELYFLREKYGMSHDKDFLNVGAMGHASSIAAGIALGAGNQRVVCLDGDAALIMHLGSLTTSGKLKLKNFVHIVLNNGSHESVGGQPSAGFFVDFTAIAKNSGYRTIGKPVDSKERIKEAIEVLLPSEKPVFIEIRVKKGMKGKVGPLKVDHHKLKDIFIKSIHKEI